MRALVLQHGEWGPPGLLADWALARGIALEVHRADLGEPLPEPDGYAFIVSLGSKHNPRDTHVPEVAAELEFVTGAIEREVPVLGLCYGGQVLAAALGGQIEGAPAPELGWHTISSRDPALVPEGPWLQWHYHRFTLPPGAEALARSPLALQAFRRGPHLGVQFHPESTTEIVRRWAHLDAAQLAERGLEEAAARLEEGRHHEAAARRNAFALFDAFRRLGEPDAVPGATIARGATP